MDMDLIVLLDNLTKEVRAAFECESKRVCENSALLEDLKGQVQDKTLEMDPGFVIQKAYRDGTLRHEPKIKEWNSWMSSLRKLFVESQETRRTLMRDQYRRSNSFSVNLPVGKAWKKVVKERSSMKLSHFVDKDLEPVIDMSYESFSPGSFSSLQRAVSPLYVSRFLKRLKREEMNHLHNVFQAELRDTEPMLEELLRMKSMALSEYEMAVIERKRIPKSKVTESPEYQKLSEVFEKMKSQLTEENESYLKEVELIHQSIGETVKELSKSRESFRELNERLDTIGSKRRNLALDLKLMNFLKQISTHLTMSAGQSGPAFAALKDWTLCVGEANGVLDTYLVTRDGKLLDNFLADLVNARKKTVSAALFYQEMVQKKEPHVQNMLLERPEIRESGISQQTVAEKRNAVKAMMAEAYQRSVERVTQLDTLEECSEMLLRQFRTVVSSKPVDRQVSILRDSLAPELEVLMRELESMNRIITERQEKINRMKQEIENLQRSESSRDKSDSSLKVCKKAPGIDAKFTQARMRLACNLCDRQAVTYVGGCGHMICEKCEQKAKKTKQTQCPACGMITSEFTTIKY